MSSEAFMREDARAIFRAGVAAVEPAAAVRAALRREGDALLAGGVRVPLPKGRVLAVGVGKAAAPMAAAVEEVLWDRLAGGVAVTKYGHGQPLQAVRLLEAGHPVPDENGVRAAREISGLLADAGADDLVICLVSGGGSALLPAPVPGVALADKMEITRLLLASGAGIGDINTVRKHLSTLKGGGLARAAAPAAVLTLILSDVVGDPLDIIASGPTVPDPSTFADALGVLHRYRLEGLAPAAVHEHLARGAAGREAETPKADAPLFRRVTNILAGNNAAAVAAASAEAQRRGYRPLVLSTTVTGETREVAAMHAAITREILASGRPAAAPVCLLSGGETTVTLRGDGTGGRNQEFVLAVSLEIEGRDGIVVLSGGTDGTDGPTDAAGALADGATVRRGREAGMDPRRHLDENNSYPFFAALGDLLVTGPTRTNVMDLRILLVGRGKNRSAAIL